MQVEGLLNEVVRRSIHINLFSARDEVYQLSMLVNDELDRIRTVYIRQACDEVTGDYLSRAVRDLIGLQWAVWSGVGRFTTSTSVAGVDVVLDKLAHARPPVVATN